MRKQTTRVVAVVLAVILVALVCQCSPAMAAGKGKLPKNGTFHTVRGTKTDKYGWCKKAIITNGKIYIKGSLSEALDNGKTKMYPVKLYKLPVSPILDVLVPFGDDVYKVDSVDNFNEVFYGGKGPDGFSFSIVVENGVVTTIYEYE